MSLVPWDTRFAQALDERIERTIRDTEQALGSGAFVKSDMGATAIFAVKQVGVIEGLRIALGLMGQVHKEMTGKKRDA